MVFVNEPDFQRTIDYERGYVLYIMHREITPPHSYHEMVLEGKDTHIRFNAYIYKISYGVEWEVRAVRVSGDGLDGRLSAKTIENEARWKSLISEALHTYEDTFGLFHFDVVKINMQNAVFITEGPAR